MKIKKKNYNKELDDAYWNGVKGGINFALQSHREAERYKDNIEMLKARTAKATEMVNKFVKLFGKVEE